MSLSEVDRQLLQRCLDRGPRAWQDFIDRFLGLVVHVANHTARSRGLMIDQATRDDLVAEVFLALVADDFGVLRRFRRSCSLATYLTVISRRVIVRRLMESARGPGSQSRNGATPPPSVHHNRVSDVSDGVTDSVPDRIADREEVEQLMLRLDPQEASIVRMFHLEGKSYSEISSLLGLSENSIGPVLSRARDKMRNGRG
ncbi:sigma-70 family RNA polymerase sigma factor [Rubripirellula amarantea]|uniref:RNA polymerase sigma factor SigX n=1 Tax=Rubripirellula amarantea TaxID=2527999 RepID=A0A5C5WKT6_9BACT|nr:sigma-70 family RNA polymerase sigma factor [Rubripirellula amarantea]MDA8743356.1 sigma-70 family RNA polymerase sigma factor [Rubripirellula amarantea]TWT51348.1 RNA polymerase sigma factor SigX [Rubripirellula amarantea]